MSSEETICLYNEVAEKRLLLLQRLACCLKTSPHAIVKMNLPAIEANTAEQARLCVDLRQLGETLASLQMQLAGDGASHHGNELHSEPRQSNSRFTQETAQVRCELARLVRLHAALLQRSSRSVHVLMNVLASRSDLYDPRAGMTTACGHDVHGAALISKCEMKGNGNG